MGLSVDQYDATPALTVDWDLALARTEDEAQRDRDNESR